MANTYLTNQDVENYGPELLDVTQRAALTAVAPHLQQIQQDNAALRNRLATESRRRLDAAVAQAVPNYREIDRMPEWHRWLLGIDPLSGRVRQQWLNDAIAAGDTNRVVSFFRGFQQEAGGAQASAATQATSSRTRTPVQGRIYRRDEIAKLYRQHEQGAYRGREAEWNRLEVDIIRAGAEGRILNPVDVHGNSIAG